VELVGRVTSCGSENGGGGGGGGGASGSVFGAGGGNVGLSNQQPIHQQQQQQQQHHRHQQHVNHALLTYSDFATCGGLLKDAVMSCAVQALPACMTSSFAIKQMKEQSRSTMLAAAKFEAKQQKLQDAQKKGAAALEVAQHHHKLNPKPLL